MSEADTLGLRSICIHVVSVVNEVSQKNGKTKSSSVDIFKVVSKSYKEKKKAPLQFYNFLKPPMVLFLLQSTSDANNHLSEWR